MKKLLALLVLVVGFASLAAAATTIEEGDNGGLRTSADAVVWKRTSITVAPDVLAFGDAWKEAYKKPGMVVAVKARQILKQDGLFHTKRTDVADTGIVYDAKGVRLVQNVVLGSRNTLNLFLPFWFLSVITMGVFAWEIRKGVDSNVFFVFTAVVFAILATGFAAVTSIFAGLVTATAFITAVFVIVTSIGRDKKMCLRVIGFYSIAMSVSLAIFLIN